MTLSINSNIGALHAQRIQSRTQGELATALARLSSGLRINGASDDAAGLAIADRFTAQIRGTSQAGRNANDAISLAQTAEGGLASIGDNLQRIRELAVQSANATNSAADRASLQLEVTQLQSEIDRVASQTRFNGINLLDGSFSGQAFQVGADAGQSIALAAIPSVRSQSLGTYQGFSIDNGFLGNISTVPQLFILFQNGVFWANDLVAADGRAIAAAVNVARMPGLSASANPTVVGAATSSAAASAAGSATFTINGVAIALAGSTGAAGLAGNRAAAVQAINANSAATGVVANDTGSGVGLVAADGRNIALAYAAGSFTGSSAADFGLASPALTGSSLKLSYALPAGTAPGPISLVAGAYGTGYFIGTQGTPLSGLDIGSAAGANDAIESADRALETVNRARASLGAVQSRFAAAAGTLQSAGANLSASRSRIVDANFAVEAATYSRGQVLQQAGTAMLAQANHMPASVLALLRS